MSMYKSLSSEWTILAFRGCTAPSVQMNVHPVLPWADLGSRSANGLERGIQTFNFDSSFDSSRASIEQPHNEVGTSC